MSTFVRNCLRGLDRSCLTFALAVVLLPEVIAAATDPVLAARADFQQGRNDGDSAAVDRSAEAFKRLSAQDPGNPLFLAYYGSAVTLQAKLAFAPWNKMRYAEDGLEAVDKSLALLQPEHETQVVSGIPVALVTRLVAVSTYVAMPGMFHRLNDARDVLQLAYKSASYREAPADLRAAFAYQAALIAQRNEEREAEIAQLRQVLALGPATVEAPKAIARLKELGQ